MEKLKEIFKVLNDNLALIILLGGGIVQGVRFLIQTHMERKALFYNEGMTMQMNGLKKYWELYYQCVFNCETINWKLSTIVNVDWDKLAEFKNAVEQNQNVVAELSVNMLKMKSMLTAEMIEDHKKIEEGLNKFVYTTIMASLYFTELWTGQSPQEVDSEIIGLVIGKDPELDINDTRQVNFTLVAIGMDCAEDVKANGSLLLHRLIKKSKSWF